MSTIITSITCSRCGTECKGSTVEFDLFDSQEHIKALCLGAMQTAKNLGWKAADETDPGCVTGICPECQNLEK